VISEQHLQMRLARGETQKAHSKFLKTA